MGAEDERPISDGPRTPAHPGSRGDEESQAAVPSDDPELLLAQLSALWKVELGDAGLAVTFRPRPRE